MSFPGRGPPLMPGMPAMSLVQHAYPMQPLMQQAVPLVPSVMFAQRAALPIRPNRQPVPQTTYSRGPLNADRSQPAFSRRTKEPLGPPVTVFIGNITERAPDGMVRLILNSCGTVHNWKRVQGASGKLQAFGFCEFGNPDAALRAIRLLHDLDVSDKKLVAKVDSKTQEVLEKYKSEKRSSQRRSPLQDETPAADDDYVDADMRADDESALKRIQQILADYAQDMSSYTPRGRRDRGRRSDGDRDSSRQRAQEKVIELSKSAVTVEDGPANLEGMEVEEEKKDLISREIGKFRDQMKRQEEEKERTRRERPERDISPRAGRRRSRSRSRSRPERIATPPPAPPRRRSRSRSQVSETTSVAASTSSSRVRPGRERERDREREHKRRTRSREREEEPAVPRKSERDLKREKEEEEEAKERKKLDRKAREKEAAYQERLRNWETREQKRQREVKKEAEREKQREHEAQREAKKLKEFLEDYDDEKDDAKYYKGRELQRRLAAREREAEEDTRDQQREKEELEELRQRIQAEGHNDPSAEYERQRAEREEQYRPKLRVKPERPPSPPPQVVELAATPPPAPAPPSPPPQAADSSDGGRSPSPLPPAEDSLMGQSSPPQSSRAESVSRSADVTPRGPATPLTPAAQLEAAAAAATTAPARPPAAGKKKKLDVKDVFNQDDDDGHQKKRRKLVPLDHDDDTKKKEEKKRAVKSLIEKIPTSKEELFSYTVDWDAVDSTLMERRIRPWINKKIAEYIGEPEPILVDFICSKILVGSTPQAILDDVQTVLDEEADVFVVKMWRLLIYEIQAKKNGLVK
ncbi:RNA-binding protein 25-like isoform X2 [Amphibalanus amphitrite]|uniref:RNA-binding protein 25-like isoform X2 n=1 Tax=Amphibalanus amphitrite TaxID=1232801 RepID=UPI001C91F17D|nr:RNA-binding protein 25-like isoform X2 [Amphibalanus amphitrite]